MGDVDTGEDATQILGIFKLCDLNGDGFIDSNELKTVLARLDDAWANSARVGILSVRLMLTKMDASIFRNL